MACHTRSNSFPSRPHPLTSEFDSHLRRIKASEAASTSSTSICGRLNGLQDLHDCVDKLLQLPHNQQSLVQEQQKKRVDELLNGSLRLLDMSSIAKDALLQSKECVQELQSIFRRRRGDEISITGEVKKFLASRKAAKKSMKKALRNLSSFSSCISEEHETITMLKEADQVTFAVFEALLSLISGPKASSKSSWSLVSKLMSSKRIACEAKELDMNEFEKVDAALSTPTSKSDNIIRVQNQLQELESSIQDLEGGLETVSRHLIKTRVLLLNALNN